MTQLDSGATILLDLAGSTQTTGVSGSRYDHARRLCQVTGLTADVGGEPHDAINDAINNVVNVAGLYHQNLTTLPLQSATARKFGATKAFVTLNYARGRNLVNSTPTNQFPHTRATIESLPVYRYPFDLLTGDPKISLTSGLPSGDMYTNSTAILENELRVPPHYMWKRVATKFYIPTTLSNHPYSFPGVAFRVNKINNDSVAIGSVNFASGTLRFDGAVVDVDVNEFNGIPLYYTLYEFTAIEPGHFRQMPEFLDDLIWTATDGLAYAQASFLGAFPLGAFPPSV